MNMHLDLLENPERIYKKSKISKEEHTCMTVKIAPKVEFATENELFINGLNFFTLIKTLSRDIVGV